jgi:hypothetical protein
MDIVRLDAKRVKLCCNKKNCPVMEDLGDGMVKIIDDDGNHIVVKKEQAVLMSDGVKALNEQKLILG